MVCWNYSSFCWPVLKFLLVYFCNFLSCTYHTAQFIFSVTMHTLCKWTLTHTKTLPLFPFLIPFLEHFLHSFFKGGTTLVTLQFEHIHEHVRQIQSFNVCELNMSKLIIIKLCKKHKIHNILKKRATGAKEFKTPWRKVTVDADSKSRYCPGK